MIPEMDFQIALLAVPLREYLPSADGFIAHRSRIEVYRLAGWLASWPHMSIIYIAAHLMLNFIQPGSPFTKMGAPYQFMCTARGARNIDVLH